MVGRAHIEKARMANLRWVILLAVKNGGRLGIGENTVLLSIPRDIGATINEIREAADYLKGRGYLTIEDDMGNQAFKVTPKGIDLVEYDPDERCPRSIGRPPKYWDD